MESEVYRAMSQRQDNFWWHQGMRKITSSVLLKHLPRASGLKILDAGCGTGGMFPMLKSFGEISGIDKSPEAIELAKEKNLANVQVADVDKLPFEDEIFDLVLCSDVLYHKEVNDDNKALKEFYRVLSPGGHVVIREAAYNWLRSHHDRLVWTKHRYTKPELIHKLEDAGFTTVRSSYINFFLFPVALIMRLTEKIRPAPNSDQSYFIIHPALNNVLKIFLSLEAKIIKKINFPFGLSIICLAKKK